MADINYLIEFQTETGEVTAAGREVERLSSNLQNIRTGQEGLNDLNQLIHAIEQAGGNTTSLRAEFTRLSNTFNSLPLAEQNRQIQLLGNSAVDLTRHINSTTSQMERLFGVRTSNTINGEIAQINASLATLRQRLDAGTISQEEFNRMSAAGQNRLNGLQSELNQTATSINRMDNASNDAGGGIDRLTKNLMGLAGAYVGIDAVRSGIESLIETSKQMDSLNQKLEYATGGAKEAGETFSYLKDMAKELGLNQMDLADGYAQLASATKGLNMSQEDTRTSFEGVAKATAAMSLTADEANGVFLALSQIASKGKVSMEELRGQLGERLTPAFGIAAQAMGVTTSELEKMVESGINAKEFLPKFGAALSQSFNEQAANNIHTTTGEINLLTNAATDAKEKLLNSFAGDAISSGINLLTQGIEQASDAIDSIDPATIDMVKDTVEQLGGVASTTFSEMMELLNRVEENFQHIQTAINGAASEGERLTLIQSLILGINVSLGAFNDGLKTLGIAFDLAIGVSDKFFAGIARGLSKVTFGEVSDKLKAYATELDKSSGEAFDRANKKTMEFKSDAVGAMQEAADATAKHMDEVGKNAEKAAEKSASSFDKMAKDVNISGEELAAGFSEALGKATSPEQVDGLIARYGDLFTQGKITGEQLAQGMNAAKVKSQELEQSVGHQIPTMDELGKAGEKSADNIKAKMGDTANALGLDFDKASTKSSQGFEKMAQGVLDIGQNFDELKAGGYDATNLIMQGIEKAKAAAKNKADFDLLNATIKQMGDEGKLSGDQVKQAIAGVGKAAEGQGGALQKLGVSVVDANNGMSKGGMEMISTLKAGVVAIKEQSTSATALKTSLQQAFETSIAAAKTKGDFVAIKKTIDDAGVASSLTADQLKILNAGIAGGGEAAKASREEIEKYNKSIVSDTKVTFDQVFAENKKWIESQKSIRQAYKDTGDAAKEAAEKGKQAAAEQEKAHSSFMGGLAKMYDSFTGSIVKGLQNVGISGEQSIQLMNNALKGQAYMMNSWDGFFRGFANARERVQASIDSFNEVRNSALGMTQTLGSAAVTTNDLGKAQLILNQATTRTVDGIVKMDNATLDNLKRQIDSTKQKFDDLSKSAKDTANNLEAELARIKGDDATARQIEQTKKLADLQDKINEARKRGNAEESAQLQRALEYQKQINAEETKQAAAKAQQEQQRQQQEAQQQAERTKAQNTNNTPTQTPQATPNPQPTTPSPAAIVDAIEDRIARAKQEAITEFMKQLETDLKRQAR